MSRPKRPLVPTGIVTEFGEIQDDPASFRDELGMNADVTYVPGFSDLRRAADMARAEGKKPLPLPINLRWVRRTRRDGSPTNERTVIVSRAGFVPVTKADVGQPWLTSLPAGCQELADGSLGNADMVLMKQDAKTAGRRAAAKTVKWLENTTGNYEAALKQAGARIEGSDPVVEHTIEAPRVK